MLSYIISTVNGLKIVLKTLGYTGNCGYHLEMLVRIADSMQGGSRNFSHVSVCVCGGGGVHVNNSFYRRPIVYFKENHNFPWLGVQHSPGGIQLLPGEGGSNCIFF